MSRGSVPPQPQGSVERAVWHRFAQSCTGNRALCWGLVVAGSSGELALPADRLEQLAQILLLLLPVVPCRVLDPTSWMCPLRAGCCVLGGSGSGRRGQSSLQGRQSTSILHTCSPLLRDLKCIQELTSFPLLSSAHSFPLPAHWAAEQCGPQRGHP